jgi:hypothetical protein
MFKYAVTNAEQTVAYRLGQTGPGEYNDEIIGTCLMGVIQNQTDLDFSRS